MFSLSYLIINSVRCRGLILRQTEFLWNAFLAAATARSTSAYLNEKNNLKIVLNCYRNPNVHMAITLSPSATSAITLPVAGFTVGKVFRDLASTNSLLINN